MSPEQIETQIAKLCAAFSKPQFKQATFDLWASEFERCDHAAFCKAMKLLQYGEKFPNWGMIWVAYRVEAPKSQASLKGCSVCSPHPGKIFFRSYNNQSDEVFDLVGACIDCAPNKDGLGNVRPSRLHQDRSGVYRLPMALDHDRETGQLRPDNEIDYVPGKRQLLPAGPPAVDEIGTSIGPDDPDKEKIREENKKRLAREESDQDELFQ